jgi:deoxyxylulose-5-phosphate synthase
LTRIKNREAQWKIFNKIITAGSQTTVQQVKRMVDSICGTKLCNEKKAVDSPQAHYSITPLGQSGFRMVLVFNGNNREDLISAFNKLKEMIDGGDVSEQPIISETHCAAKEALPDIGCENANSIVREPL